MIKYDPQNKTIHMSLFDLEHCGFSHDEFAEELFMSGLDQNDKNLLWPDTIVVDFACGAARLGAKQDAPKPTVVYDPLICAHGTVPAKMCYICHPVERGG